MGFYKRMSDKQSEIKRYNAARRKADKLSSTPTSRLIRMETISEIERYNIAQDTDRLTAFNKEVEQWQDAVSKQLKATIHPVVYVLLVNYNLKPILTNTD